MFHATKSIYCNLSLDNIITRHFCEPPSALPLPNTSLPYTTVPLPQLTLAAPFIISSLQRPELNVGGPECLKSQTATWFPNITRTGRMLAELQPKHLVTRWSSALFGPSTGMQQSPIPQAAKHTGNMSASWAHSWVWDSKSVVLPPSRISAFPKMFVI